jgi:molybdate transport system substrate-binding protein
MKAIEVAKAKAGRCRVADVTGDAAALFAVAVIASGLTAGAHADNVIWRAAVKVPIRGGGKIHMIRAIASPDFMTPGQVDEKLTPARPDIVLNVKGRIAARMGADSASRALVRDLGIVRVGMAVRAGAPRPDLGSVASLRESLLRATSITYTDPARGGTVGVQFARVIDDMGLRAALAGKVVLAANGLDVVRKVANGEAELGVTQVSEILHVDATVYAGPLPEALHLTTIYTAWAPDSGNATARMFVDALTNAGGRDQFRAAGFD